MRNLVARVSLTVVSLAIFISTTSAHPDVHEVGLLFHFAPGVHKIQNGEIADLSHSATARVEGKTSIATVGPTEAFVMNGKTDWLTIAGSVEDAKKLLPTKEFTVAAWVNLNAQTEWGGICGLIRDNGDSEQGWMLGYNQSKFTFALASKGSDDGNGRLTVLAGKTDVELGRWCHVVATYDGVTMRLYVNGKSDGESTAQSGDILYPTKGTYTIGCFIDDNEQYPLDGAVYEVKAYSRVLSADDIASISTKNANLIKAASITKLQFLVKPYLQFGTQTSMTVMCETSRKTKMTVDFAERQPLAKKNATPESQLISELVLTDLKPQTSYFYRVTCEDDAGGSVVSDLSSFQTAPKSDSPWAFTVVGDTQRNPEITRKCAEYAYALRPNFMLHCGDVVDNGHAKNQWLKDLFEPMSVLTSRVPMFPVIGNHEGNSHWYYDYFSLPKPEYFYTFEYGNSQFFMIDSNKPLAPDSEQYKLLEKALASSKATWKITCHHHPCFTSDDNDYGDHIGGKGGEPSWGDKNAQQLVPLYEKYGVDIAFNGHVHNYERTWPIYRMTINQKKGVRYITSGGGGGHLETAAPQRAWFSVHHKSVYHICYATVHDRTIQFKAIDLEGRMFDMFEMTKPEDR
ncbi:MAG: metallophosphoesterase [Schlesneria sp.]|nr:metallophosphoesterase [Schlesneria sp.]